MSEPRLMEHSIQHVLSMQSRHYTDDTSEFDYALSCGRSGQIPRQPTVDAERQFNAVRNARTVNAATPKEAPLIHTAEAQALAYAIQLDRKLAAGADGELHDALVFGVGDLCGGRSERGFVADVQQEIDEYEASQVRACGSWVAFASREAAARNWLDAARSVMAPHEQTAKEAA